MEKKIQVIFFVNKFIKCLQENQKFPFFFQNSPHCDLGTVWL